MLRRSTFGLLASGGVLFLAGAVGLTEMWSVVAGTASITMASVLLAVVLDDRGFDDGIVTTELPRLEGTA